MLLPLRPFDCSTLYEYISYRGIVSHCQENAKSPTKTHVRPADQIGGRIEQPHKGRILEYLIRQVEVKNILEEIKANKNGAVPSSQWNKGGQVNNLSRFSEFGLLSDTVNIIPRMLHEAPETARSCGADKTFTESTARGSGYDTQR